MGADIKIKIWLKIIYENQNRIITTENFEFKRDYIYFFDFDFQNKSNEIEDKDLIIYGLATEKDNEYTKEFCKVAIYKINQYRYYCPDEIYYVNNVWKCSYDIKIRIEDILEINDIGIIQVITIKTFYTFEIY